MQQILLFIVGLSVGILVGLIMKTKMSDLAGDMIVGVLGAYAAGTLFSTFTLSQSVPLGSFFAAAAGALVFVSVVEAMKKI